MEAIESILFVVGIESLLIVIMLLGVLCWTVFAVSGDR